MSVSSNKTSSPDACADFGAAAELPHPRRKVERTSLIAFRVTASERARIEELAGTKSLSAHIRSVVLGDATSTRRRSARRASADEVAVGRLLASLGQSRLSQNMNQIAKGANLGTLPVTEELTSDLAKACADIAVMRASLIAALGLKDQSRCEATGSPKGS